MRRSLCGGEPLTHDLADLPKAAAGQHFDGVIGGPPCQAHSKLKSIHNPKFPGLMPLADQLMAAISWEWFDFENVRQIHLEAACMATRCNAMHFYQPHQPRVRLVHALGEHPAPEAGLLRRRGRPDGVQHRCRPHLRPQARRQTDGLPRARQAAIPVRATSTRLGGRCAIYHKPGKYDHKGTGAITDQVDNVITVWRNKSKERQKAEGKQVRPTDPDTLLICDKQRNGDWEGNIGLWHDPYSQQFLAAPDDELLKLYLPPQG